MKKKIEVFREYEQSAVDNIMEELKKPGYPENHTGITDNCRSLASLADLISTYPSILDPQNLGKNSRSIETLVKTLCSSRNLDLILHIPTKAVLGKSFTIAKINFFLMLSYICRDTEELVKYYTPVNQIVSQNIFEIMSEDVFISIVSDMDITTTIRETAGLLLTRIWENRIYMGLNNFTPILTELWEKRKSFLPSFGTMVGVTEIINFCSRNNHLWISFLEDEEFNDDRLESLKEYLMGLTYEEISTIQSYMQNNSIHVLDQTGVSKILNSAGTYYMHNLSDPREMYHFYTRRKENSDFREKSSLPGPKKTIEEYIMCYLLKNI